MKKTKTPKLIEFKGSTVPVIVVTVRSLIGETLEAAASELFGDSDFFDGDAGLLELSQLEEADSAPTDWTAIKTCFARHGLKLIGVRGGSDNLLTEAAAAGLAIFPPDERAARPAPEPLLEEVTAPPEPTPLPQPEPVPEPAPVPPPPTPPRTTLVVDRPLRSGQQVYARGSDLVVLALVNPGAEVIADGSIHIYAPLRGRALAGASGDTKARIFTTRFEAELVSVAGVYRTFDTGVPDNLATQPVQVRLVVDGESNTLHLDSLRVD